MSSQRPFFANFLAAFRAHSSPVFNAKSSSSSPNASVAAPTSTSTTHVTTTTATASTYHPNPTSNPRSISTKATAFQQTQSQLAGPSIPDSAPTNYASNNPTTSLSRSPNTTSHYMNMAMSPPGTGTPLSRGRQRRGSDSSSSSGGFRDILGQEKWYIGGKTAGGEEKFYRLGLVTAPGVGIGGSGKRVRSLDRLSL